MSRATSIPGSGASLEEDHKRRLLRRSELFASLAEESVRDLVRFGTIVQARRRDRLAHSPPALFVLGSGRVRVMRRAPDREITFDYHGPGTVVGEMALIDEQAPGEAIATEHVEALRVPVNVVRPLLAQEAKLALRLTELMGQRRRNAEHRVEALLTRSVESRIAEFLLESGRRYGVPDSRGTLLGVKFTHYEIASFVGSTRETVTLILNQLKRRDMVATDHRRLILTDEQGLEELV